MNTTKKCCMCHQELSVVVFKSNKNNSDGLQSQCIECQKEYRRQHYLKNKQKYIDKAAIWTKSKLTEWREYKSTLSCEQCGENNPACLDFHHNEGEKESTISGLIRQGCFGEKLIRELDKCIVLCANCHRKLHFGKYYEGEAD